MAKKRGSKKSVLKYLPFLICLLGVAAFAMLFLDALKTGSEDNPTLWAGTDVVFGKEGIEFLGQKLFLAFNILGLLGFALPLLGGIFALVPMKKSAAIIKFGICFVLFVAGAVLLFIMPSYTKFSVDTFIGSGTFSVEFSLAIGTILGGVFAALGALTSAAAAVLK